jgi:hypothetical protein
MTVGVAVVVPLWHVPARTGVIVFLERLARVAWRVGGSAEQVTTVTKPNRCAWNGHPGFAQQNAPKRQKLPAAMVTRMDQNEYIFLPID